MRLEIGQPADTLVLANGAFYDDTGGQWVFVVDESGDFAVRRDVRFGRRNPEGIEVLEGLARRRARDHVGLRKSRAIRSHPIQRRRASGGRAVIKLEQVSKKYRTTELETTALDGVDFGLTSGEFVAVMGPSGCGKSTLLNIVGLIDNPSSGHYFFGEREISQYSESRLANLRKGNVGFIFQSFNLIDELNVYENVELPLLYQKVSKPQRRNLVREALELVGLSARAKHKPDQLSGGQQQRVAVARAVVGNPKLILADEPTGNLDSKNGEEVLGMLTTLNEQGTTVLMVTHSPTHAARAHRIVNLLDGRVVAANQLAI